MIDPRQRYDDLEQTIRLAHGALQARLWTALPGIVQSYNAQASTVDVQPALAGTALAQSGEAIPIQYSLLRSLPVIFPRGGNCTLTFPIAAGDECLVIFAARCIDAWWQNGGANNRPAESRMHSFADGFAVLGPFSQVTKLAGVSTTTVQLRSNDGSAYVELNPGGHIVNIVAPGGVNITGPVVVNGSLLATQNITSDGDVVAGTVTLKTHVHTGVASGGSTTGLPTG